MTDSFSGLAAAKNKNGPSGFRQSHDFIPNIGLGSLRLD